MSRSHVVSAVALILVTLVQSDVCSAQSKLSLDEAVAKALKARASLAAEGERISAASGLKLQAGLRPNPEFQFQNENLRPGQSYGQNVDTLALLNLPLDILGKRRERVALANKVIARTQAEYDLARWQVSQNVKLAYWVARGAQEIRDTLKTTVNNFQKTLDYHAAQLSAGAIPEVDFLRVRLEGERLKIFASLALIEANRLRVELLKEMGQTDFTPFVLTEPLAVNIPLLPIGIDQVLAQRIEMRVARASIEQALANTKLQDVLARPDVNLTFGYKRTQVSEVLGGPSIGANTAVAGFRITLPSSDKNQGNKIAAQADTRREQQLLVATEAAVRADYAGALQDYELRRAEFTEALQPLREHAANISEIAAAAYREGGTDLLRLLDAERARLDAELAWARGMVDYRQSIVRLEAAEGVNP